MLTRRQSQLLQFLSSRPLDWPCPSFDEMRVAIGLKSKSGVFRIINALEERGFIRRQRGKCRAIEVVRSGDSSLDYERGYRAGYIAAADDIRRKIRNLM